MRLVRLAMSLLAQTALILAWLRKATMSVLPLSASATLAMKPSALGLTLRAIWLMSAMITIVIMVLRLITGKMMLVSGAVAEGFSLYGKPLSPNYKFRGGYFGLSPTKKAHFLLDAGSAGGPKAPKCFIHKEIKIMRFYLTGSIRYCII